jgi:hypothetical protein
MFQAMWWRGFTSVELIIGIFTFAILSGGIISLATVATRLALDSERRVVALALVNERLEVIRALPYEQIDYPLAGALIQEEKAVSRNQQTYQLETLVVVDPDGLQKKIQVTASWLVPAGGTRDVQVVTYVSATPGGSGPVGQVACIPGNTPSGPFQYDYSDNFLDNAFTQCVANCRDASKSLPPWQCCGWSVKYTIDNERTKVKAECSCTVPVSLPGSATDHPAPGGEEYTQLARACSDGTRCGTDSFGQPKPGQVYCEANCLKERGDCLCQCPT